MRTLVFPMALALLGLVSCVNDIEGLESVEQVAVPLAISVVNQPQVKGQVTGAYLPDGANLGVFLRATDGSRYDGLSLQNVKFSANGEGAGQTWSGEAGSVIGLSSTVGTAYAFYPWYSSDLASLRIPITNDGTDWMYAVSPAQNLSVANNLAQFSMRHALSIIRCRVVKGHYAGDGKVTTIGVSSPGLAHSGTMDLEACSVTDYVGAGTEIAAKNVGNLGEEPLVVELWAVPTNLSGVLSFRIVSDGDVYLAASTELTVQAGGVYNYTITVNSQSVELSKVTIDEWVTQPNEGLIPDVPQVTSQIAEGESDPYVSEV